MRKIVSILLMFFYFVGLIPINSFNIKSANANTSSTIFKTYQIEIWSDDATESKNDGDVDATGKRELAIDLGTDKSNWAWQIAGFRFQDIDIPNGSTVKSAHLRFFNRASKDSNGDINLTISWEPTANSVTFANTDNNISNRTRTNAKVIWSPEDWWDESLADWSSSEKHKTSDITPIVNEIISSWWNSWNAMTFFIEDEENSWNTRSIHTFEHHEYDDDKYRMARLTIEYEASDMTCDYTPNILTNGEYLPDYSYAGYKWGEEEIPNLNASSPEVTYVDVTSYGATPNDSTDDTDEIKAAITAHKDTVGTVILHFPAWKFIVSDIIWIKRGDFIIQWEGSDTNWTIFDINIPLSNPSVTESQDILDLRNRWENHITWPVETTGVPYSLYSYEWWFFYTRYDWNRTSKVTLANVVSANQDDITFVVNDASKMNVGDVVNFEWENDGSDEFADYFVDWDCSALGYGSACNSSSNFVHQPITITAINGNTISIKEPLMHDLKPSARIRSSFFIENVGFENFSIDFPDDTVYGWHHAEDGYNGIYLTDANQSWIDNVAINNSDSAILVDFSKNTTLKNITTTGRQWHYNVYVWRSYWVLTEDFNFWGPALHNPSFNTDSNLTVYKDGYVAVAEIDQHMGLNHNNLADNIKIGYTPNLFYHGWSWDLTAWINNTFWNIEVGEVPYNSLVGEVNKAPWANLVGIYSPGNTITVDYTPNPYIEGLNECLTVPSLYEYQLAQRGVTDSDTTAPKISEVTPVSSSTEDTTPDYTFTTDEAGTITYNWSCDSTKTEATVWDNTITFNELSDWTYSDCTITVTDSSDNISDVLDISEFVVETITTTPTISEVTPVSTPTTDTTPSYTFTSNKAWTITYSSLSNCASTITEVSAGNNTINFDITVTDLSNISPLADGEYSCRFKVVDEAGNSSAYMDVTDFVVETGAPVISEVAPISTPTSDTSPNYVLKSSEPWNIIYEGSCSSTITTVTPGNNIITFNELTPGTYSDCKIKVVDSFGKESNSINISEFTIRNPPTIDSVIGTIEDKETLIINGNGFWEKTTATPLRYDNFENGISGNDLPSSQTTGGWYTENHSGLVTYSDEQVRHSDTLSVKQDYSIAEYYGGGIMLKNRENAGVIPATQELYVSGWFWFDVWNQPPINTKFINMGTEEGWQTRIDSYPYSGYDSGHLYAYLSDDCTMKWTNWNADKSNVWASFEDVFKPDRNWHRIETYLRIGSDGYRDVYVDGVKIGEVNGNFTSENCNIGYLLIGHYFRKQIMDDNLIPEWVRYWDELYVDTTQSRVEICEDSDFSNCTHKEIQIPTAWNNTTGEITVTLNQGSLDTLEGKYLYVVDSDGNPSEWYLLGSTDTTSPTISEVTAVSTPTSDTTPNYTFTTDEAWTITYNWSCDSTTTEATVWDNTITFNELSDWTYSDCTITVTDSSSNVSNVLNISEFEIIIVVPDTTPPTISEITPISTPTDDITPDYTFTTDEAGTITYNWSCDSTKTEATVWDNTITFNELSDWTYSDCTITVTDSSDNISDVLDISEFVVETITTTPTISEVTPVSTPTTDTTPSYTFTSNKAWTITYSSLSNCASTITEVSAGNNTINFDITVTDLSNISPLADGEYSCRFKVVDEAGNSSAYMDVTDFVVETGAPVISEVAPISTPTSDTSPNYVLKSSEPWNIIYEGSCSSTITTVTPGNNIITFNELTPGTYSDCKIKVVDSFGKESNSINISEFTIRNPPTIDSVIGEITNGSALSINGANFGDKSTSAPLRYDDFEDGVIGSVLPSNQSGGGWYNNNESMENLTYSDEESRYTGRQSVKQDYTIEKGAGINLDNSDDINTIPAGTKEMYVSGWFWFNMWDLPSNNLKFISMWTAGTPEVPEWVTSWQSRLGGFPSGSSNHAILHDDLSDDCTMKWTNDKHQYSQSGMNLDILQPQEAWHRVEVYLKIGTPGYQSLYIDGVKIAEVQGEFTSNNCNIGYLLIGHYLDHRSKIDGELIDASDPNHPKAVRYWDELYVDTTQSRVEICEDSDFSNCTHKEIQIPTAWNNTTGEITVTLNQGSLDTLEGKYLYVVDSDGNPSEWYLLGSTDTTSPTISEVTAVSTPTSNTTPNYTFTTDEAWTITYNWSCDSTTTEATVWDNTITFNTLSDWTYSNCEIKVTDTEWNISNTLSIPNFTVNTVVTDTTVPRISEVSGIVEDGESVIISGAGFGLNGPNVILFDDFKRGVAENQISLAATLGSWSGLHTSHLPYYTEDANGNVAAYLIQDDETRQLNITFDDTQEVFFTYKVMIPSGKHFPYAEAPNTFPSGSNWKLTWLMDGERGYMGDDDIVIPTRGNGTYFMLGWNDNAFQFETGRPNTNTNWFSFLDWNRFSVYLKGGTNPTIDEWTIWTQWMSEEFGQKVFEANKILFDGDEDRSGYKFEDNDISRWNRLNVPGWHRSGEPNAAAMYDDIYLAIGDNSAARVEIGNAPVYTDCTKLAISTPETWNSTEIELTVRKTDFESNEQLYLFVIDADNNPSEGYLLGSTETSETDTESPTISEVTAVSTPTSNTTPNYTFTTDEAWTITYNWSCDSTTTEATVWDNTITFNELSDWTYSDCTITVTDSSSNVSNVLNINEFVVNTPVSNTFDFNEFAKTNFGAEKEPMIYEQVWNQLEIFQDGVWVNPSLNSASIGWDTNLPAHSYVEYGEDTQYGKQTSPESRYYYVNLNYLKNLKPETIYHYRLVSTDERGNKIFTEDATFTTLSESEVTLLPKNSPTPIILDQPNTKYVLEGDITTDGRAIQIEADNITLDLNGHTIIYDNAHMGELEWDHRAYIHNSSFGVYINGTIGTKIFNGTIKQGDGQDAWEDNSSIGFNPIYAKGIKDVEIAGVNIDYGGPQMIGLRFHWSEWIADVHHNIFNDSWTVINNRHGSGNRSMILDSDQEGNVHHNLVKRTRQRGLSGKMLYNNEVYVDSWSTNSFAMSPSVDSARVYKNRIFGTGFNVYGFGWANTDLKLYDNIVHFVGKDFSERWDEDWGDINMLSAIRVTNYGGWWQERDWLEYYDNLIVISGSEDSEIRGVEFFSDETIHNLYFHDNIIKTEGLDNETNRVACVVAQGYYNKPDSIPVIYSNNTFISNRHHVAFGDSYGKGNNHHFDNCTFISSGGEEHPDYSTFIFWGSYRNYGHIIKDCIFESGTAADSVRWGRTASDKSYYEIYWTLTVKAPNGSNVQIKDLEGASVFQGVISGGEVKVPLIEKRLMAGEWHIHRKWEEGSGMLGSTVTSKTQHSVIVTTSDNQEETRFVEMTKPTTLEFFVGADTTSPTISEVTAVSTPTSDTTPNYTFTTDEAWTITYNWSCDSTTTEATVWDNTITFNELSDWTYSDCTITVTDSSDNISNVLNVTEFVVNVVVSDTTPPTLNEVTPVPSPTNDPTPNYTFNTNESWTITYSGDCSSPITSATTWTNTIVFNTLADWSYTNCGLTVTDASWNISSILNISDFEVNTSTPDTTPPSLTEITTVPDPTNDSTPSYTFSTTEAGFINYSGDCIGNTNEASSWDNTITFNTLADWSYTNCGLTVTDASWNISSILNISDFEVETSIVTPPSDTIPPSLTEINSVPNPTNDTTPNYTFSTTEAGFINYSGDCIGNTNEASSWDNTITFNTLADWSYTNCSLTVTDASWNISSILNISDFEVETSIVTPPSDTIPPSLTEINSVPNPTNDTTPNYTFSTTEAGFINYSGDCIGNTNEASSWDNTITFNTLADWSYTNCSLTVTDASWNISDTLNISDFEVETSIANPPSDTTPPFLTEVNPVSSPTSDNTPSYTFYSSEAWNIIYHGWCVSLDSSASTWNNTITFKSLSDGTYNNCGLTVTDSSDNVSEILRVSKFIVNKKGTVILPVLPTNHKNPIFTTNRVFVELASTYCWKDFSDISNNKYKTSIKKISCSGIVNGYKNWTFRPNNNINRLEVAKILSIAFGFEIKYPEYKQFSDVSKSFWYAKHINPLSTAWIFNWYNDWTFRPKINISRIEFLKVVLKSSSIAVYEVDHSDFSDVPLDKWYAKYVMRAKELWIIEWNNWGKYYPKWAITRGEVADIIAKILELQ